MGVDLSIVDDAVSALSAIRKKGNWRGESPVHTEHFDEALSVIEAALDQLARRIAELSDRPAPPQ